MFEIVHYLSRRTVAPTRSRTAQSLWRRGYRDGERQPKVPHHWTNR